MRWLTRVLAALGAQRSPERPLAGRDLTSLARSGPCDAGRHEECALSAYESTMQCRCECHRFTLRAKIVLRSATESMLQAWLQTHGSIGARGMWALTDGAGSRMTFVPTTPAAHDRDVVGWMPTATVQVEIRGWTKALAVEFTREQLLSLFEHHDGAAMSAAAQPNRRSVFDKGDLSRGVNAHGIALGGVLEELAR